MARRKRYNRGRIYITDDSLFSRDGYSKKNRRVVALNENKNRMHVAKIKGLYDDQGKKRKKLIPIEKYPDIRKPSGIYPHVYRTTAKGAPIKASKMKKTNTRLNKWDMRKISRLK